MNRRHRAKLVGVPADRPDDDAPPVPAPLVAERVASLLSPELLRTLACAQPAGARTRCLPLPAMALLLVTLVVRSHASFAQLLRALADGLVEGLDAITVSRQAFSQRLIALGAEPFLRLLREATAALGAGPERRPWVRPLAPWAVGLYALDDTTLDALARKVDWLWCHPKGDDATLGGRLATLLDLETGKLGEVAYDADAVANEKTHLRPLLERLAAGSLVVFDLGYFAFPLFDWLTARGLSFVTRLRAKTSYRVERVLCERPLYRDRLVALGAHRSNRAAHPVRLVELCLDGVWWSYVTNVLEPERLPAASLWRLYAERWQVERAFAAIKRALGLAKLHAVSAPAVLAQVWTTLLVYQVLQQLRLEVAASLGLGADDVSWQRLLGRVANYAQLPPPKPPLRDWLVRGPRPGLAKEGVRAWRARQLPDEVLAQAEPPAAAPAPPPRRPRQGERTPSRRPVLTVAGLSGPPPPREGEDALGTERVHRGPNLN